MARRCSHAAWLGHHQLISKPLQAEQRQETEDGLVLHRLAKHILTEGKSEHFTFFPDGYTPPVEFFTNLNDFFRTHLPVLKAEMGTPCQVFPELRLSLDEHLRPAYGYPNGYFVGSLDLALYNPDTQDLIVLDYKTERNARLDLTDYYRAQLALYVLLVHHAHAPVKRFQLVVHAVFPGKLKWLTEGWTKFDPDASVQDLVSLVNEALENLKEIKPKENSLCIYCSYRNQCPLFPEG